MLCENYTSASVEMLVGGERLEAGRLINWELWLSRLMRGVERHNWKMIILCRGYRSTIQRDGTRLLSSCLTLGPSSSSPSPQTTQEDEDLSLSGLHLPLAFAPPCSGQCME